MAEKSPTTLMIKDDGLPVNSGTARRLVRIYVEVSPAQDDTTGFASHITNLATMTGLVFNGSSTGLITTVASMATFSTTTVTWKTAGQQFAEFVGYYT